MPGVLLNDVVENRNGQHDTDRGALRNHSGRQRSEFIREPFVCGMDGYRIGGSLAGTECDS